MAKIKLTAERLQKLVNYDPKTGIMTWKLPRPGVISGSPIGHKRPDGYLATKVSYQSYLVHRLVWLYVTGEWPKNQIDHRDGNRTNNRFENLRDATQSENNQNQKCARRDNVSTRLLGVTIDYKRRGKKIFVAQININDVHKNIGRFATAAEAHEAYLAAKRLLHPFNTL
jgi:hypothetical protein